MELKKTTILSAFVVVAGIISEIIFRDVLSKGVLGIVISIVLAAITFVAFYFMVDGLYTSWDRDREEVKQNQKEMEQKIYSVINEQLKFQKIIYSEVHRFIQSGENASSKQDGLFDSSPLLSNIQSEISEEDMTRLIEAVNGHSQKLSRELQESLSDVSEQTSSVSKEIESAVTTINEHTSEATQEISEQVSKVSIATEGLSSFDISGDVENISAVVNAHTTETVQKLEDKVEDVSGQTAGAVKNLEDQMMEINSQTVSAVKDLEEQVTGMNEQALETAKNLESQIANVERQTSATVRNLEDQIAGLENQTATAVKNLEDHISGISNQTVSAVQNLENQMTGLHSQTGTAIRTLESQMADMSSQTMEAVQDIKDIVTLFQLSGELPSAPVSKVQVPPTVNLDMDEVVSKINDNTMSAAKVVVKYIGKTTEDIKKKIAEVK